MDITREELKQFYLYATKAFVFLSLFSPLVISAYFFFPFIVPKTIFFQIAVAGALFFYALLVFCDRSYVPKFDLLTKSILGLLGVWVLAAAFGENPARSFLGSYERMLSVVNFAHFVALFIIMRAVFSSLKEWLVLLRVFLGVSIAVALYGIAQQLGFSFVYHASIDRIDSTIGNAAFLGGYAIFAIFFALFALARDTNPWFRALYFMAIPLNAAMIYFSATRGAAVGLFVGLLCLGAAYIVRPRESFSIVRDHVWKVISVVAIILLAVFLLEKGSGGLFKSFQRFSSVSLSDATVQTRILAARTSMDGFLARPILGWGPENYNLVFDKYYNPKLYPTENWFDHAHNIVFDTATATGAVGLFAYLFLFSVVFARIIAYMRASPRHYFTGAIIGALMVAYIVQNMFVFDSLVTYLPFFMVCALVGVVFRSPAISDSASTRETKQSLTPPSPLPLLVLVPLFAFGVYWADVRPAMGAYNAVFGFRAPAEYALAATGYFDRAIRYSTFGRQEIRGKVIEYMSDVLQSEAVSADKDIGKDLAEYAITEMEKGIAQEPMNFRNYLYFSNFLGNNYELLSGYDIPAAEKADDALMQAETLAPQKPILYIQWGRIRALKGDVHGAVAMFEKAVALNPDIIESHMRLATAYRRAEAKDKALIEYRTIAGMVKSSGAQTYVDLAVGFASVDAWDEAIMATGKAIMLDAKLTEEGERFIRSLQAKKNTFGK